MFKLSRMAELECSSEKFEGREDCAFIRQDSWNAFNEIKAVVRFDKSAKWKVIDDFGFDELSCDENGDILLNHVWPDRQSFFHHLLSFGDKAEILEPLEYRAQFSMFVEKILKKYDQT